MNNEEMLRVIRTHTLEAIFQVMRVAVNNRKGQKQLKILGALHLKSTLPRPTIYKGEYPEKHCTVPSGNPVGVKKPSIISLFV